MPLTSLALLLCIMVSSLHSFCISGKGLKTDYSKAISEGHGDTALVLLKAGAETDKRDVDGNLAIDLAPDKKVDIQSVTCCSR